MKKIAIIIGLLLIAIVGMAYLYFSRLNVTHHSSDISLHAATSSSGFIFSFKNEKGITDILKEQPLFAEILGTEKYQQLSAMKQHLLSLPKLNLEIENQVIYIAFVPGKEQETDFICFTQLPKNTSVQILDAIKAGGAQIEQLNNLNKITLADHTVCYLAIKESLVILSGSQQQVLEFLKKEPYDKTDTFADYINTSNRINKNSLARLYLNFNTLPPLLKNIITGKLNGELSILNNQDAFAALTYNYSKDKLLLTGTTIANEPNSYYNLFADLQAQKLSIQNMLPANTSSYTIFSIDNYEHWQEKLKRWTDHREQDKNTSRLIQIINEKHHLNLDKILPKYFKDQLITFQLNNADHIGAINLTNGDKLSQLLLDLSSNYNDDIKVLKEDGILYAYFGLPFKNFKRPFYTIFDNYMVFANNAGTLQAFLNNYNNNQLLINTPNYISASNQLPSNSSISFYFDHNNSSELIKKNVYAPYYTHIQSEDGLKKYDSFTYQLSGDNGKFQTTILLNKQPQISQKDSLAL